MPRDPSAMRHQTKLALHHPFSCRGSPATLVLSTSLEENLLTWLDPFEITEQIGSPVALARRRLDAALTKRQVEDTINVQYKCRYLIGDYQPILYATTRYALQVSSLPVDATYLGSTESAAANPFLDRRGQT